MASPVRTGEPAPARVTYKNEQETPVTVSVAVKAKSDQTDWKVQPHKKGAKGNAGYINFTDFYGFGA